MATLPERAALLPVLCFGAMVHGCSAPAPRSDLSPDERRQDLDYVARVFAEHDRSFTPQTRAVFESRLREVRSKADSISHDEFIAGIQWAVAAADNGHTEVLAHEHQRRRLPVDLRWFSDGLHVIAVRPGYEPLLGARVTSIEDRAPETVLEMLDPYTPGNDAHARLLSGYFLERCELLAAIGAAREPHVLVLRLVSSTGEKTSRTLECARRAGATDAPGAERVLDTVEPLPLYLREPERSVVAAPLTGLDALYVRISRNDDEALPQRLDEFLAEVDRAAPRHVVVDLRLNGGGNYALTAPFAERLPDMIPGDGRLVIVVGARTFSAGIVTAAILKARGGNRALVVGEPPGDDLEFWAEGGILTLPNSRLRIHYSDGYHDWQNGFDPLDPRNRANPRIAALNERHAAAAGSLAPDVHVDLAFADYAAGRDPVMSKLKLLLGAGGS